MEARQYYQRNREKILIAKKRYYQKYKGRILRDQYIKYWSDPLKDHGKKIAKRYGINREQYQQLLLKQSNGCAICGYVPKEGERRLAVDHDHNTGRVRGLLCTRCNRMLSDAQDKKENLESGINYLAANSMALGTGASSMPDEKELE